MKNNFQSILEDVLTEKKSIMTILDRREQRELVGVFKTANPAVALQQLDDTDMFDKVLDHLLGGRPTTVIKTPIEADWMISQLEFDNKFINQVRASK